NGKPRGLRLRLGPDDGVLGAAPPTAVRTDGAGVPTRKPGPDRTVLDGVELPSVPGTHRGYFTDRHNRSFQVVTPAGQLGPSFYQGRGGTWYGRLRGGANGWWLPPRSQALEYMPTRAQLLRLAEYGLMPRQTGQTGDCYYETLINVFPSELAAELNVEPAELTPRLIRDAAVARFRSRIEQDREAFADFLIFDFALLDQPQPVAAQLDLLRDLEVAARGLIEDAALRGDLVTAKNSLVNWVALASTDPVAVALRDGATPDPVDVAVFRTQVAALQDVRVRLGQLLERVPGLPAVPAVPQLGAAEAVQETVATTPLSADLDAEVQASLLA